MMVVGGTLGGILGSTIGVVNTIYIGAAISGTSGLAVLLSPVVRLRDPPEQASEPETLEEKIEEQPLVPPSETGPPQIEPPIPLGERAPLRAVHAAVAAAGMNEHERRAVAGGLGVDAVGPVHCA